MRSDAVMNVSKYDGLLKIGIFGLPCPDWRFVSSAQQIPDRPWCSAPHGWTVRCAPHGHYSFGLPSKHRIPFDEIGSTLVKMSSMLCRISKDASFVIYPSWQAVFAGCCLVTTVEATIECVVGDIAGLLRSAKSVDCSYSLSGPYFTRIQPSAGAGYLLSDSEIRLFSSICRLVATEGQIVLEWTKTSDWGIVFHDWQELPPKP